MKVFSRGPISHNGLPDLYPTTFSSLKPQFPLVESCNQENVRFVMFSDFFQLFFLGRIFTTVPTLTPLSKVQSRTCMSTEKIIVLVMQQKRRRNITHLCWFTRPRIITINERTIVTVCHTLAMMSFASFSPLLWRGWLFHRPTPARPTYKRVMVWSSGRSSAKCKTLLSTDLPRGPSWSRRPL